MADYSIIMLKEGYGLAMKITGHEQKLVKIGESTFIDNMTYEDIKEKLNVGDILEVTASEPYNILFAIYGFEEADKALEAKIKLQNSTKRYNMLISKVIKRKQDGRNKGIVVSNPITQSEMLVIFNQQDEPFKTIMIKEGDIAQIEVLKLPAKTKYVPEDEIYITPNIEANTIPLKVSEKPIYFYRIKGIETVKDETLLKLAEDTKESWEEVAKALEAAATAVKVKEKISIKETSLKNVNLEWKISRNDAIGTFKSHVVTNYMSQKFAQKFTKGVQVKLTHEDNIRKFALARITETFHTKNSIGFNFKTYPGLIYNILDIGFSQEIDTKGWTLEIPPDFAIPTRFIAKIRSRNLPMFNNDASKPTKEISKALLGGIVEAGKAKFKKANNRKMESYLTDEQKEIILAALDPNVRVVASESVAGSGKSKTLTIIARELLKSADKNAPLLLCASTNVAVRHILTEVVKETEKMVNNSVLFLPSMHALKNASPLESKICTKFSLYNRLMDLIQEGIQEPEKGIISAAANILQERTNKLDDEDSDEEENVSARQQATDLKTVETAFKILLSRKPPLIIAATLSMVNRHARNLKSIVKSAIFDEAATMTMIETLAFVSETSNLIKIILMGDSRQLSSHDLGVPEQCKSLGFASALEHVYSAQGDGIKLMKLTNTFRFTKQIADFVAEICYDGDLKTNINAEDDDSSLLFVDCKGKEERLFPVSRTNKLQTAMAKQVMEKIRAHNKDCSVAILTYYNGQRNELKAELKGNKLEICNIDSFQGKEADIIIILTTLVDSKSDFVNDKKRLCVSLTRGKKGMIIIGHSATLEQMSNWKPVIEKMKKMKKITNPEKRDNSSMMEIDK